MQPNVAEGWTKIEYGRIEREFRIDASPEVVYEVISSPAHIREWWHTVADFEPVPGAIVGLVWGNKATTEAEVVSITVIEAKCPRLISFRWVYPDGEVATAANSLLVTFELVPFGSGTMVRLTEAGFREMGWEAPVLEEHYNEHSVGWDTYFGSLHDYLRQMFTAR